MLASRRKAPPFSGDGLPAAARGRHAGPGGKRCYAIGDVHGRMDLLQDILRQIEADLAAYPVQEPSALVFLGDLIDRGPQSRQVVECAMRYTHPDLAVYAIKGNHEDALVKGLRDNPQHLTDWLRWGGIATAESYGIARHALVGRSVTELHDLLTLAIPPAHIEYMSTMLDCLRFGDFLLVHAGIRPGVPLEAQSGEDLRWIREPFLSSLDDHDVMVIHGHTISEGVDRQPNRIGIDTGADAHGCLTAIRVEGTSVDFLQAHLQR